MNGGPAQYVVQLSVEVALCILAATILLRMLRANRDSLGIPVAYLFALFLLHMPGAALQIVRPSLFTPVQLTEYGMEFVVIGTITFVIGVWLARAGTVGVRVREIAYRPEFWTFCLFGGWFFIYGLTPLRKISSVGAAVEEGGGIWMLGVMLAMAYWLERHDLKRAALWFGALTVYPFITLITGGFLSYGSTVAIIVLSILTVTTRKTWRILVAIPIIVVAGMSVFATYFAHRDDIRAVVWGGGSLPARLTAVYDMLADVSFFNPSNQQAAFAVSQRLNQNYFVGLAAQRIDKGESQYLDGQTISDAVIAVIPRAIWPDKPAKAGSGNIVSNATGLYLDPNTSWGVGNVMELEINFGVAGVVIGFLLLGYVLGALDKRAAVAYATGRLDMAMVYFLPCFPLIQPNGSLVELTSGSAAAVVAAYGWRWVWKQWELQKTLKQPAGSASAGSPDNSA